MKLRIRLTIDAEIEGDLLLPNAGDHYANKIPGCILSENEDSTSDWALLTQSIEVTSCEAIHG